MPVPYRLPALLAAALLLAGCAALPAPGAAPPVPVIAGDPPFEVLARVAARRGEQGFSGSLRWRHDGASDELTFSAPLGAAVVELRRDASGVVLRTADGELRAASAEQLLESQLGFALPLAGLRHWMRGQTGPDSEPRAVERDARGRLTAFVQDAWQVRIAAYAAPPDEALPARLDLEYGEVVVRIAVERWLEAPR
jgi:outer membrane lipoprotein LolB